MLLCFVVILPCKLKRENLEILYFFFCKSLSVIISTNNKSIHLNILIQHRLTNIALNPTSKCHLACFNNEISTCCLMTFVQSRRCKKCINQYTYHMDQQLIIQIFQKPVGSFIVKVYQRQHPSYLGRIFADQITLQQQSVQKHATPSNFQRILKEIRRRCHNQVIWCNIRFTVCLHVIFVRNERGWLETYFLGI